MRTYNLPSLDQYLLPAQILKNGRIKYFNESEAQFIEACNAFNLATNFDLIDKKMSKIIMGEKIQVCIQDIKDPSSNLFFEFNERDFTGLMRRYRSPSEIRRMIADIFKGASFK